MNKQRFGHTRRGHRRKLISVFTCAAAWSLAARTQ